MDLAEKVDLLLQDAEEELTAFLRNNREEIVRRYVEQVKAQLAAGKDEPSGQSVSLRLRVAYNHGDPTLKLFLRKADAYADSSDEVTPMYGQPDLLPKAPDGEPEAAAS